MARWVQINGELVPYDKAQKILNEQHEPKGPAIHIFHEGFYEHISAEPIYIKSKQQLREETRSRGCISDYAE